MYNKYRKNKEGIKMFNIEEELKKLPGKICLYGIKEKGRAENRQRTVHGNL